MEITNTWQVVAMLALIYALAVTIIILEYGYLEPRRKLRRLNMERQGKLAFEKVLPNCD